MATISVVKKHHLPHAKAKSVAERMAKDLRKRYDLACTWDGDTCRFDRAGLSGNMHVAGDRITLDVKLGFLLSAVAQSIERAIHTELDALVGASESKPAARPAPKTARKKA
ncbi:hypothetical protein BURK1_03649 [Burkholderiales bacterium]|nr:hypothetical protein BURK1_03649 [Burkholderiales bacterium]